jgi:hypothetical protein
LSLPLRVRAEDVKWDPAQPWWGEAPERPGHAQRLS